MAEEFISELIRPALGSGNASAMSAGEPGFPARFVWRKQEYELAEVLEKWKETSDCTHGSKEKYVRKHWFRIRTTCGAVMKLYFERQVRRGASPKRRWWLSTIRRES